MKVRVTWPDGSKTEEVMNQEYRNPGEIEDREDYYILQTIRGAVAKINVDRNGLCIERL